MSNIIWKPFYIGELFERSTKLAIGASQKDLTIYDKKNNETDVALISASRNGSGRVGYIDSSNLNETQISINKITFDDQWGFTFFQQERFVITGGHNAILEVRNGRLKELLDKNINCYSFISLLINNVTIKTGIYGYGYKINNKLDREIILLPCIEVESSEESIFSDSGVYYTLATNYIKELMEKAKVLREQKTIRLYEAEREKYEAEREKYEAEYKKEKEKLIWKAFSLGELFITSTEHYLEKSKKNYDISEEKNSDYPVAVCSASKNNNGIVGYISEVDDVPKKKRKGYITKGGFGHFFFQNDWFIKPGGSWGMADIIKFKHENFKTLFDSEINMYYWISKVLTKIFVPMSSFGYAVPFDREIIMLPCLEVNQSDNYVFEDSGHYYTLAVNFIAYLYLTGRVNYNQKLIDNYTYQY